MASIIDITERKKAKERSRKVIGACAALIFMSSKMFADNSGTKIHGVVNYELSNQYITPRGLVLENQGLVSQPFIGLFFDLYDGKGFLSNVTGTAAVWNSIHSHHPSGVSPNPWYEFDSIAGLSARLVKRFELGCTYLYFTSPKNAFADSKNIELRLGFDDSDLWIHSFGWHPYLKFFVETDGTAAPGPTESTNLEVGMEPSVTFQQSQRYPLTLTVPTFMTFPQHNFYAADSTVGLFSTGINASVPLAFVPGSYGHWSVHAGMTYYYLNNPSLVSFLTGPGGVRSEAGHNEVRFSGGLSLKF